MRRIIFTDLDGSLLDHDTYCLDAARPALERVRREGIPLVLVTSKTRSEVEALERELGLDEAFVVENGAAIYLPPHLGTSEGESAGRFRVIVLGKSYAETRAFFQTLAGPFDLRGFGDMEIEDIIELTGLERTQADFAARREYTEPFVMSDESRLGGLEEAARKAGFAITRGGRFHHLIAAGQSKGVAVSRLTPILAPEGAETLGVGDSPNDIELLAAVDVPIVIPRPSGESMETGLDGVINAPHPGSRGWNEAILQALDCRS